MGSSTVIKGNGCGSLSEQILSPICISEKPAIPTMSPAKASSISTRPRSWKPYNLVILPLSCEPSACITQTCSCDLTEPFSIRPITILPTYSL